MLTAGKALRDSPRAAAKKTTVSFATINSADLKTELINRRVANWHRKSVRPLSRSHFTLHCICYICLIKKTKISLRLKVTYRCCDKF